MLMAGKSGSSRTTRKSAQEEGREVVEELAAR